MIGNRDESVLDQTVHGLTSTWVQSISTKQPRAEILRILFGRLAAGFMDIGASYSGVCVHVTGVSHGGVTRKLGGGRTSRQRRNSENQSYVW